MGGLRVVHFALTRDWVNRDRNGFEKISAGGRRRDGCRFSRLRALWTNNCPRSLRICFRTEALGGLRREREEARVVDEVEEEESVGGEEEEEEGEGEEREEREEEREEEEDEVEEES